MTGIGFIARWALTIAAVIAWIVFVPLFDALANVGRKARLREADLGGTSAGLRGPARAAATTSL
jgi:hypothetical protein